MSKTSYTSESLTIRAAEAKDASAIVEMETLLAASEGHETRFTEATFLRDAIEGQGEAKPLFFIAEIEGEAAGFVMCYAGYDLLSACHGIHLGDIYVHAPYRNKGIGSALFAKVAEENLTRGGEWVSLTVLRENVQAQRFYFKHGGIAVPVEFMAFGKMALKKVIEL